MIRALYGGTFDPFHAGHLHAVRHLLDRGHCDHVHVVPAGRSPFKTTSSTPPEHRFAMARAALAGCEGVDVDARELERPGPSWTVETLEELASEHPEDDWLLVIGADTAAGFFRWRDPERLLELARPLVLARSGDALPEWGEEVDAVLVSDFDVPVNATELRRRLAAGEEVGAMLSPPVLAYIRSHGLYGSDAPCAGGASCP